MTVHKVQRTTLTAVVVVLQVLVLLGIAWRHGAQMASGTTVTLAAEAVDPLDLARGAYVQLRYPGLDARVSHRGRAQRAFVVFDTSTSPATVERITADEASIRDDDTWIRLPIARDGTVDASDISTWYTSSDDAQRLERELARRPGRATLSVTSDGDATLMALTS